MQLKLLHFAEYAALTQENKLVVAGIFDNVNLTRRPDADPSQTAVALPPLYLVAVLDCSIGEGTVHQAALRILDEDGNEVAETIQVGQWTFIVNRYGRPMRFQAVMHVAGLAVPRPGDYAFKLLIDGNEVGETLLYVSDVTPTPPA